MFQKLRLRFLVLSTFILLVVILITMAAVYLLGSNTVNTQIRVLTSLILDNDGTIPYEGHFDRVQKNWLALSAESLYETRYFSVLLDSEGNETRINTSHIVSVDKEKALDYAQTVCNLRKNSGRFVSSEGLVYFFEKKTNEDGSTLVVLLDISSRYWIIHLILLYMGALWFTVLVFFIILMGHYSQKMIRPFIENDEKQKRFITNASHELKTPLAVISANTEMAEALGGSTKWTESTKRQLKKLQSLIEDLVVLTRLDEMGDVELTEVDFSGIVRETCEPFRAVIESSQKIYQCEIRENLHVRGEKRGLLQITSILMDNAVKYCDDNGKISVKLLPRKGGKGAVLTVSNTYRDGKGLDFNRFFERFYRQDESHNSQKEGFGIGLSMAKEMAARMKGQLKVSYSGDMISFIFEI